MGSVDAKPAANMDAANAARARPSQVHIAGMIDFGHGPPVHPIHQSIVRPDEQRPLICVHDLPSIDGPLARLIVAVVEQPVPASARLKVTIKVVGRSHSVRMFSGRR